MRRRTTTPTATTPTGEIIITLESEEKHYAYATLGVTFESTDQEILDAVAPVVEEETGIDILGDGLYTIKKVESSHNTYAFPKSPAGERTEEDVEREKELVIQSNLTTKTSIYSTSTYTT